MNILHVIGSLDPRAGGPVSVLLPMAKHQANSGHKVTICTTNAAYPSGWLNVSVNTHLHIDGVEVWYFAVSFLPLLFSRTLKVWFDENIRNYDVVHIHGLYRFPVTYAAYRARKENVPYVVMPHGALDPFLYKQSAKNLFLKRLYERFFDFPNLQGASAIHYTAQEEMERVAFLKLRAPGVVIANGLDWSSFENLPAKCAFRKRLHLTNETPLILFLGRLSFVKGLDLLIPSFSKLLEHVPNAHLAIVGPDNEGYGTQVRQWCRDYGVVQQVHFVDHLPAEKVREAFVDADVFALTSYTENFGMTVAEAMACECPVVLSEQVKIFREVQKAGVGVVVPLDVDQIASALRSVLEDVEQAKRMGQAGRVLVREKYAWDKIIPELDRVYRSLVFEKSS